MHVVRRRPRTSACLLTLAFALLVSTAPARADDCPFADATSATASSDQLASATLCLLNQQRAAAGLRALSASAPLADTASRYAAYMVSTDHFAHVDESGHDAVYRVLSTNPGLADRWSVIGENLGWGTYDLATPRAMVEGWMNSPTHRDNILYTSYDEIGVGIADGAPVPGQADGLTYATVFGEDAPQDPPAPPAPPAPAKHKPKKHVRHRRSANKAHAAHRHHKRAAR